MAQKLLLVLYGLIMFVLGVLLSFGVLRQTQLDTSQQPSPPPNNSNSTTASVATTTNHPSNQTEISASELIKAIPTDGNFSTHSFDKTQVQSLIARMPDHQLARYMSRFLSSSDAKLIDNKRQFAERAIEELYGENDNQPLTGRILLSNTADFPSQSLNTHQLNKTQKLYAHLDTHGKLSLGANVFIKWTNRSTGEVLLFEKKRIVADSHTNWVSYQPHESWQVGDYDIRFYEFNDKLTPVAQLSYRVNQVSP